MFEFSYNLYENISMGFKFESHDVLRDNFKKRLNSLLSIRGKATQIVDDTDIPKTSISTWKNVAKSPIPDIVDGAKIAKACGITVEHLVFGDEISDFEDRSLLELARKYRKALSDLEAMDELQKSTVLIQIEAVADSCRETSKKKNG